MSLQIAEFTIKNERDVAWAAQRARLLASLANMRQKRKTAFGKATTLLATQLLHGNGGTITFGFCEASERPAVEAVFRCDRDASDEPTAVANPPVGDVQSLVDSFSENAEEGGAAWRIELQFPGGTAAPSPTVLAEWGTVLATRTPRSALATSHKRIQELAERLEDTQRQGVNLQQELAQVRSLNETLELLALVASKTDNAVIIADAAGVIEWINDGFVRITGLELPDVRGTILPELFGDSREDGDAVAALHEALASGHGVVREIQHARKTGEEYWASLSVTPVFSEEGAITRWIGIANDVTERHRYEHELLLAKEAAESASRTKSEFLANISHEIRTPMNAIIGMTELTLDTELSSEQHQYLQTVQQSAESLLALLNDLLDLSKIEAGRLAIDPVPLYLRDTLNEILRSQSVKAEGKGLQLKAIVRPDIPDALVADPMRLRQILTNLVDNAIKFTEQGEIEVYVASEWRSDDEVGLRFHVRDTGIGIATDKLASIFDSFTQAESSTARHYGGTGLGLAICRELTGLMGGRLWVESEVGQGSTFHFTLRVKIASDGTIVTEPVTAPADLASPPQRTLHILVADDNPANRMLATRILEKRGHSITQATNGREVLEACDAERFDIALLDIQMPDLDGFACTRQIRRAERSSKQHLPIIAVTAYAMKGDRDRCLAAGMDNYISKPLRADRLIALVEALAEGRGVAEERVTETKTNDDGFDFTNALARLEGDVEIFKEQIDYFLNDSPALLDRIRQAIDTNDANELHIAAHRLNGLASSFDADAIVSIAQKLEQAGHDDQLDDASNLYAKLVEQLGPLREALRCYGVVS